MDDDWTLVLIFVGLLILARCFELWVQQSWAADVHNNTPALQLHLRAAEEAEGSHPGRDMDRRIVSTPQGMTGRGSRELKVTCRAVAISLAGAQRELSVDLYFKLDCITTERHTKVQLTLDQVDMDIDNCCTKNCSSVNRSCAGSCCVLFIYGLIVQVCPKDTWAKHCQRIQLEPHLMSEVYGLQRSSSYSVQMPIVNPNRGSFTYQKGKSVSHETPAYRWAPASRNISTRSVTWTWELSRFIDGSELVFNTPRLGPMPQLGIQPSHVHNPPGSFRAEACWELPPNEEMQQQPLEWDMQLSLHIALPKKEYLGLGHSISERKVSFEKKVLTFS